MHRVVTTPPPRQLRPSYSAELRLSLLLALERGWCNECVLIIDDDDGGASGAVRDPIRKESQSIAYIYIHTHTPLFV